MTIRINDFFLPASPAPSPTLNPTFTFGISFVPNTVTIPALGIVTGYIASVILNLYTMFYYRKAVMAEDLTSSKFYMKRTILIREILFSNTTEA